MAISAEGSAKHYMPTAQYSHGAAFGTQSFKLPPPNIVYTDGVPGLVIPNVPYTADSEAYGNPEFLKALSSYHMKIDHSMLIWEYEMRRTAQELLPFMFLGPSSVARDVNFVREKGITLLVAVRSSRWIRSQAAFLDPTRFPSSVGLATLTLDFDEPAEFIARLKLTVRDINNHLESTSTRSPPQGIQDICGKVLIFCESGNERSALLAAAYLVVVYGVDAAAAIHTVQAIRFCVMLSDEMKHILEDLHMIISAERQVSLANAEACCKYASSIQGGHLASQIHRPGKRTLDDFCTSDDEIVDDIEQTEDSGTRTGIAPFRDIIG